MRSAIQARLDSQSRKRLAELVHELGWTPSRVVREGLRILEASYLRRKKEGIIGLRKFPGAPEAVIENVVAGIFKIPFQLSPEALGLKQVLRKFRDRKIDLADT